MSALSFWQREVHHYSINQVIKIPIPMFRWACLVPGTISVFFHNRFVKRKETEYLPPGSYRQNLFSALEHFFLLQLQSVR